MTIQLTDNSIIRTRKHSSYFIQISEDVYHRNFILSTDFYRNNIYCVPDIHVRIIHPFFEVSH